MSSRDYIIRRLKSSGIDFKNTSGKYIRVRIHRITREVEKVKPSLWTDEAREAYTLRYPNDIDAKLRSKSCKKGNIKPVEAVNEEKDICSICYDELPKAKTTLKCGHSYCTGCILKWFQRNDTCPMCRAVVEEAPKSGPSQHRIHINTLHANDIIDLTNRILNGERNLIVRNSFTNSPVELDDIRTHLARNGMLARRTRRFGSNGHRYARAVIEVINRLSNAIDDQNYVEYFGQDNHDE